MRKLTAIICVVNYLAPIFLRLIVFTTIYIITNSLLSTGLHILQHISIYGLNKYMMFILIFVFTLLSESWIFASINQIKEPLNATNKSRALSFLIDKYLKVNS